MAFLVVTFANAVLLLVLGWLRMKLRTMMLLVMVMAMMIAVAMVPTMLMFVDDGCDVEFPVVCDGVMMIILTMMTTLMMRVAVLVVDMSLMHEHAVRTRMLALMLISMPRMMLLLLMVMSAAGGRSLESISRFVLLPTEDSNMSSKLAPGSSSCARTLDGVRKKPASWILGVGLPTREKMHPER